MALYANVGFGILNDYLSPIAWSYNLLDASKLPCLIHVSLCLNSCHKTWKKEEVNNWADFLNLELFCNEVVEF
jgi:hypothetical protein